MNYLNNARCYMAGPIECYDGPNWRIRPKEILYDRWRLNVFDPFCDPKQNFAKDLEIARQNKDLQEMKRIAKGIVRKDLCEIDRSDLLICNLKYKIPTYGSCHEIINANNSKKPVLLLCEDGVEKLPFWFFGFIPLDFMFGSWHDLYAYLDEVDQGKHKNNDRWHYIYGVI